MAIGDISLTSSMRSTLVSLQQTSGLMDRTQERLATGKKVNSALDNPANFFAAKGHTDRATRLDARKDAMNEAINMIKAADNGVKAISTLLENMRGIINQAREEGATGATAAQVTQYGAVITQLGLIAQDSGYKGVNLLQTGTVTVNFDTDTSSQLVVTGFDGDSADGAGTAYTALVAADTGAALDTLEAELNTAIDALRQQSASLSSNLSIIQARVDFTTSMVNTLTAGANSLTNADTNEEGANMLMLQTRQQLGTTALSLSSQAAQSVLRLF